MKSEVIDAGLCQGCGLCAGSCKHLEMKKLRPALVDYCVLDRGAQSCGLCYRKCPQASQEPFPGGEPLAKWSLRSTDEAIRANAASGGVVTTLAKMALERGKASSVVMVKNEDGVPRAHVVTDPKEVASHAGVTYGRSGVLAKLVEVMAARPEQVAVVGVPCEMRGAEELEARMRANIFRIGLFCNASVRNEATDAGEVCSPCCDGCPAGVDARGYVRFIREGKYQEALDLIRERNPLPSVCGRICTHECEHGCTLIGTDHPIAVRELKKFVTEWEMAHADDEKVPPAKPTGKKVAIIGSGPAGLTAAYYLAKMGYRPTVFEKSDKVGGMLRFGVPPFRLPDHVLDHDVEFIKRAGVEIKTSTPVGPNLTFDQLREQGYEAIFVSIGQYQPRTLHLKGEDLPGVHVAINFLIDRKYRYWENTEEFKGKTLAVIGGGPVAVDVAQTALRLGAQKVYLFEIRSEEELKPVVEEIPPNELEFMEYVYDVSTTEISKEGDKLVLHAHKVKPGPPYEKLEGTDFATKVDAVVFAIGQTVDLALLEAAGGDALEKERGHVVVDPVTFETNLPGVFAGGDVVVRGKAVAIAAIAQGREAAISIDRFLRGEDPRQGRRPASKSFFTPPKPPRDRSIKPTLKSQTENLWGNFEEIDGVFDEEMALSEAKRCLQCNHFCEHCQDFPAIHADLGCGDAGSKPGFTTVVAWTERGKQRVEEALSTGLLKEGELDEHALRAAVAAKASRQMYPFPDPPRTKVLNLVRDRGEVTIERASEELGLPPAAVRYELLRLVQENAVEMKIEPGSLEPRFVENVEC
ncbi:MAG: hypothetical protein Kow0069_16760 [Promethearchaeota archaeon]